MKKTRQNKGAIQSQSPGRAIARPVTGAAKQASLTRYRWLDCFVAFVARHDGGRIFTPNERQSWQ
jgi:hypothetical protein